MVANQADDRVLLEAPVRAYLSELAAEIVANGNPRGDLAQELAAAHARRQSFAEEMANGKTDRAQKVRAVLAAHLYGRAIARDAISCTFANFEAAERRSFVLAQGAR
jgi:hypothetical protein